MEVEVRLASLEYVRQCRKTLLDFLQGRINKAQFEEACYLLQTAAKQAEKNALEPTEDELKYAARA